MKLKKSDRLQTRQAFNLVFKESGKNNRSVRRGPYIVYYKTSDSRPRLGLSVSKRVIKRACDRNRVKRCLREFFRIHKEEIKNGDWIIRTFDKPQSLDFKTLTEPLDKILLMKEKE